MASKNLPENREWTKRDEFNDRAVTEKPVSEGHWKRGDCQVDAVPGLHYRPGRRN